MQEAKTFHQGLPHISAYYTVQDSMGKISFDANIFYFM